ncbi:ribonuclease D [Volucribacter psittacicida]|uniref:Ribonuclease D n=1 Tax=Volucribacter psittacicida TaxID=203482 RepID=A0A4R1G5T0_9PAST|nr:ribonuclease D [Volucribacter psittacicida]TCK01943.1 ribonuclease D [Volucribacter psittacicida]
MMSIKELQNAPHFNLIDNNQQLAEVCALAQTKNIIALDTEFIRVRSYYPKLGLIQLYDGEQLSLIDPINISDFSPLLALFTAPHILKVLHACSEDLAVFYHYFNRLPQPLCDTQVMAKFLNFPQSTGFANLVQHYFTLELDKSSARTDWLARPLTEIQLSYAAADVWYLLPLYQRMWKDLQQTPWQSAAANESEQLLEKCQRIDDPEKAYISIPNSWKLEPIELMRLKLLAKWRLQEAIKRDLAVNFVVKAEHLWLLAKHNPKSITALLELGLTHQEVRVHGKTMLKLLDQVKHIPPQDYPTKILRLVEDPRYKTGLKQLQHKLKQITPADLKPEVIASRRSLEKLMKWHWQLTSKDKLPELLQGWRRPFGEALLQELEYKL